MLPSLLYRDWLLNRKHVLLILGIFSAFQVYFVLRSDSARFWLVFTGFYLAFQTFVPFSREDKFRSGFWIRTLPVSRRSIVRARWVGAWLLIAAGFLVSGALALALPGSRMAAPGTLTADNLLLTATVISLLLLGLLPFTIRYGIKGLMIFLVVAQIAGAALLMGTILVGGGGRGVGRAIHGAIEGTRAGLLGLQEALTPMIFHLVALGVVLLLNWLGYRLALALYRRREF